MDADDAENTRATLKKQRQRPFEIGFAALLLFLRNLRNL